MDRQDLQFFIQRARDDLISFSIYCDPAATNPEKAYSPKPYHELIADILAGIYNSELDKVIISVPPQHGKSTAVSINFPAWALGKNPSIQFALASYGSDLAEGFSQKCRDLIKSPQYKSVFGGILKDDSQARNEWYTNKGGRYTAVGIGGPLTGKPVDILVIDDYLKDWEEAQSKTMKEKIWNRYTSVALSRLHAKSKQIIIATRWSEDDLIGRIIEKEPEGWTIINIPVYNDDGTTIRPEKFPPDFIAEKRKLSGEIVFQALYMGNPTPQGSGTFKREYFQYYDISEVMNADGTYKKKLKVITFVDPAISIRQEADNTAIITIGHDPTNNNIYVLDVFAKRIEPDDIINNLFRIVNTYAPERVGMENVSYQKMLILEVKKQMNVRNKYFTVDEVVPMGEKEARIKALLEPRYANCKIFHLKNNNETTELEGELLTFPRGRHDDRIDGIASAIKMIDTVNIHLRNDKKPVKTYSDPLTGQTKVMQRRGESKEWRDWNKK